MACALGRTVHCLLEWGLAGWGGVPISHSGGTVYGTVDADRGY